MDTPVSTLRGAVGPSPVGSDRLLGRLTADGRPMGLGEHLVRWGPVPRPSRKRDLIRVLDDSGLVGHGGAWFPVATKWESVRNGAAKRPVIVANGAEGEPASLKDALLLSRVPHLVLDGASLAASELGASQVIVYVPAAFVRAMESHIRDRRTMGLDPVPFEVVAAPDIFVAGQESAVVSALNGKRPLPAFISVRPIREKGVGGRPTLVQNVETLAHVALVARFGARWYRSVGTESSPGTMLMSVHGIWSTPRVIEAPLGSPLGEVLGLPVSAAESYSGILLGGYGGGWLDVAEGLRLPIVERLARHRGTSWGAGVVVFMANTSCPLAETARIVRYLEQQGAGQCGPCVYGLAELADRFSDLATRPEVLRGGVAEIGRVGELVEGRGACRHPDGAVRVARSALKVFGDEVARHLNNGPCSRVSRPSILPGLGTRVMTPAAAGATRRVVLR